MGLKAPSVNGDCCWRWPHPWYLAGRKWHREGGDEGPRGLGGAALAGGVKEQSGGHPRWPRWDCEPWSGRSRGTGQAALERSGGRRGSEPGRGVREVIPLAGLGPWAGDSPPRLAFPICRRRWAVVHPLGRAAVDKRARSRGCGTERGLSPGASLFLAIGGLPSRWRGVTGGAGGAAAWPGARQAPLEKSGRTGLSDEVGGGGREGGAELAGPPAGVCEALLKSDRPVRGGSEVLLPLGAPDGQAPCRIPARLPSSV